MTGSADSDGRGWPNDDHCQEYDELIGLWGSLCVFEAQIDAQAPIRRPREEDWRVSAQNSFNSNTTIARAKHMTNWSVYERGTLFLTPKLKHRLQFDALERKTEEFQPRIRSFQTILNTFRFHQIFDKTLRGTKLDSGWFWGAESVYQSFKWLKWPEVPIATGEDGPTMTTAKYLTNWSVYERGTLLLTPKLMHRLQLDALERKTEEFQPRIPSIQTLP